MRAVLLTALLIIGALYVAGQNTAPPKSANASGALTPSEIQNGLEHLKRSIADGSAGRALVEATKVSLAKTILTRDGSIILADFTFRNDGSVAVKDIEVTCRSLGASGTQIGSHKQTVYETVAPKTSKTVRRLNMGFIDDQARTFDCALTWLRTAT